MSIKVSRLTLHEIALFWAKEDADGESVIEKRRHDEITDLLRTAWEAGTLVSSLAVKPQIEMRDKWLADASRIADADLAGAQAYNAVSTFRFSVDKSQVEREHFKAWVRSQGLPVPTFWISQGVDTIPTATRSPPPANTSLRKKRKTGPRPFKAIRARSDMLAALRAGELSLHQLHHAPMKWFAASFAISRPTAEKIVEQLRNENPELASSNEE